MVLHKNISNTEGGNAVALTLLGLAVAILAGVVVLYLIGKSSPQPVPQPADKEIFEQESTNVNPREGWRSYSDEVYGFSVEFPQGWVVATGTLATGEPVISIFQAVSTSSESLVSVYGPEDVAPHISVYPQGTAGEDFLDVRKGSAVIVEIPQASANDYVLQSGKPWATKAVFESVPKNWTENGYVFTRVVVEEEEIVYMRGDVQITESDFDVEVGDRFERVGFIDSNIRSLEEEVLRSFRFTVTSDVDTESVDVPVSIESPFSGQVITSPLSVRGNILGKWYFKDDIQLRLETNDGQVLTKVPIVSSDEVTTEGEIPFEVSLVFENHTATSGKLIIHKVSAGLEGGELVVPILFNK
jgi:hypothetical protein